jgi:DNA-binding MarR family transcriptional regulator
VFQTADPDGIEKDVILEADFQRYFGVTPPSVHNMILTLERRGLIQRTPGRSRAIEVLVPLSEVPPLD